MFFFSSMIFKVPFCKRGQALLALIKKKNQKKNIGMLRIQELSSVDGWLAS